MLTFPEVALVEDVGLDLLVDVELPVDPADGELVGDDVDGVVEGVALAVPRAPGVGGAAADGALDIPVLFEEVW